MLRSLKGTSELLPIFNLSWKTGKQWDLQILCHYPEKDIAQNNKLASLTFIWDTRMDLSPWNSSVNELQATTIITASQIVFFVTFLSVLFRFWLKYRDGKQSTYTHLDLIHLLQVAKAFLIQTFSFYEIHRYEIEGLECVLLISISKNFWIFFLVPILTSLCIYFMAFGVWYLNPWRGWTRKRLCTICKQK